MNRIIKLLILTLCLFSGNIYSQNKPDKVIKVLIVDGFSNHNWRQTTKMVKAILEETGRFKVDVSTAPANAIDSAWLNWRPKFSDYDVVIQNTNNIQDKQIHWPREVQEALEKYVKSGGGLYILHSANNAFADWPEYNRMIGLGWRSKDQFKALKIDSTGKHVVEIPAGEGVGTNHGSRIDAVITIFTPHPINKGFPAAWKTPSMELYKYARGPAENLTVLSYAKDTVTNISWPVEWVVKYGKGRVYNSSMGHLWKDEVYPISYRCIGFQTTLIRATEWLATGKVTYPVPKNFPSMDNISVRDETDLPRGK
jgi:type 1 glutamine amidotransferase